MTVKSAGALQSLHSHRLVPQDCGLEVEKSDDEFPAIVQRCDANEVSLKPHKSVAKQPRLALSADERLQVALADRAADLLHDKRLPRSERCRVRRSLFDEVFEESQAPPAFFDVSAEFGIECDQSLQQE